MEMCRKQRAMFPIQDENSWGFQTPEYPDTCLAHPGLPRKGTGSCLQSYLPPGDLKPVSKHRFHSCLLAHFLIEAAGGSRLRDACLGTTV